MLQKEANARQDRLSRRKRSRGSKVALKHMGSPIESSSA